MPATKLLAEKDRFPDGSRYEIVAWGIPATNEYPEGIKYSFQYTAENGDTLLRYDNYDTEREVGIHHRHHYREGVTGLEFTGLKSHVERFLTEVNKIHDKRQH